MKKLTYALALCGLASLSSSAFAEVSGNIGIATDYLFRGISQTAHKPEISGGFDYSSDMGFYAGTWLSNQTWVKEGGYEDNSSLEIDLYGGYSGSLPADLGYDVGVIKYYYPGNGIGATTPDTVEGYASLSWKMLSLKYSYTLSKYFVGWTGDNGEDTRGSNYLELNADYDIGSGWGVSGHVGHQSVKHNGSASYTDWNVGVSKDIGYGTVGLLYSTTNADSSTYTFYSGGDTKYGTPVDVSKNTFVLSFSKSF